MADTFLNAQSIYKNIVAKKGYLIMTTYEDIKDRARDRISKVPMYFAFNKKQLSEALEKMGNPDRKDLCRIPGGGIMLKKDVPILEEAVSESRKELGEFLATDEGLKSALVYELSNCEYCISEDPSDALDALDLSIEDERVRRVLREAVEEYMAGVIW